jgi:hypothetical protein
MSGHVKKLAIGAAIAAGLAAAPAPYAQDSRSMSHGSMMGEDGMVGMMGSMMSGMMNMMGMSGDMGGTMEHCNQMMQAMNDGHAQRPNEQWRSPQPGQPDHPPQG